jgi:hypothetical protein
LEKLSEEEVAQAWTNFWSRPRRRFDWLETTDDDEILDADMILEVSYKKSLHLWDFTTSPPIPTRNLIPRK